MGGLSGAKTAHIAWRVSVIVPQRLSNTEKRVKANPDIIWKG